MTDRTDADNVLLLASVRDGIEREPPPEGC